MIIHEASGGLGNQLFNYAAARSLADRHATELLVDAANYRDQLAPSARRPFFLKCFPVRAQFRNLGPAGESLTISSRFRRRLVENLFSKTLRRGDLELGYFPEFGSLGPRTVLKGHFISPRFFEGNETRIRSDLFLSDVVLDTEDLWRVNEGIASEQAPTSLHVRGDDIRAAANAWIQLPDVARYYRDAIETLLSRIPGARLFVFTDDPAWCSELIGPLSERAWLVSGKEQGLSRTLAEFFLMTRCRHAIIANSAFSWWAAWLGPHQQGLVIAPNRWERLGVISTCELLPPNWLRIAV